MPHFPPDHKYLGIGADRDDVEESGFSILR